MNVPRIAHFVWLGTEFPWLNALAIVSALERGGFERVILHHDTDLCGRWAFDRLVGRPRFEVQRIDLEALCVAAGVDSGRLARILSRLRAPAAQANVLRVLILRGQGGVYLDLDTVTVESFAELCRGGGFFVGEERLAFPARAVHTHNPALIARAYALAGLRAVFRILPRGYRGFRAVERWYWSAVNNAVVGAHPEHPVLAALLEAMLVMPEPACLRRYALGTHLLQRVIQEVAAEGGGHVGPKTRIRILPPPYFYPLPPEIADHWFRIEHAPDLQGVLAPETVLVHWYASHRTRRLLAKIDPDYVRTHSERQLFSRLALPFCAPGMWE